MPGAFHLFELHAFLFRPVQSVQPLDKRPNTPIARSVFTLQHAQQKRNACIPGSGGRREPLFPTGSGYALNIKACPFFCI